MPTNPMMDDITKAFQAAFAEQVGVQDLKTGLTLVSVEVNQTATGVKISGVYEGKVDKILTKPQQVGPKMRRTKRGTQRVRGYRLPPPSFEQQIEAVEQDEKFQETIPDELSKFISTQLGTLGKHLKTIRL